MKNVLLLFLCSVLPVCFGCCSQREQTATHDSGMDLRSRAVELAQELLLVDTHVDIPYRFEQRAEDISERTRYGDFDYVRAREGGLDAAFVSIYVPAEYQDSGGAKDYADRLIDQVEEWERQWPDKFQIARSVADVYANFGSGLVSFPLGMENGAAIEDDLGNLAHFHGRGVRYITLTHARANQICDSSYDLARPWKGLSPLGRDVVKEMNRLGIMIDVSHVSDATFFQVLELSEAPVIASHSSCRHFTPGWERNLSDEMIRRLAQEGGVIQINFGSSFLKNDYRLVFEQMVEAATKFASERKLRLGSPEIDLFQREYLEKYAVPRADVAVVADHIDHVVSLVGIDHVGYGSDFDGVGDSLPIGLQDVSDYPNLIAELLKRGYEKIEIQKVSSGNILRVWSQVERISANLRERSN